MGRGSTCSYTSKCEVGRHARLIPRRNLGRVLEMVNVMDQTCLQGAHNTTIVRSVRLMQSDVRRTEIRVTGVGYWSADQSW